jgi:hypothetical protein
MVLQSYVMQLQAVLGALADMAAAGYPSDMQQLAAAAQLSEAAARSIAAAIRSQGQAGIGAVKQGLDAHVGFGQIKVVAALMALGELWFAAADDGQQEQQQQHQGVGPDKTADEVGEWHVKQQQQQQQDANGSIQPAALTDASNLPLPTPAAAGEPTAVVCAGMAAAAAGDQQMADAPAEAEAAEPITVSVDACSDDGDEQPAWRTVKRARPAFNISNKTGKRRRPTIAPPAAQQQALPQQQQVPTQLQQAGMVSPAPTAAGSAADKAAAAAAALTTPAGAALITQQAVLQLLWDGTATGKQLLRKLGLSGSEQEQQLQQVLQELVEDGEQVLVTPEGAKVDINDDCVRFIAF